MNVTLTQTILIFLVACFGCFHQWFGSPMWNDPIVIAPLVGLVLGDFQTGLVVGATLELIFMGVFPVGASVPPDAVSGAVIATSYVILYNAPIERAVALVVPVSMLVVMFTNLQFTLLNTWGAHRADKYAENADIAGVERMHVVYGIWNKLNLAIIITLGFYFGVPVIETIISYVPDFILHGVDVAAGLMPAIGFAMLTRMMISKEMVAYLILGFLLSSYFHVPILGIALLAVVAILLNFYNNRNALQGGFSDEHNEF